MITIALLVAAAVVFLVVLWAIQLRTHDAATVDIGWTVLVATGAIASGILVDGDVARRALVAAMASAWAARLGGHLLVDRVLGATQEDGRYRWLRERWGASAPRNFLLLYLAQLVVAAMFVVPIAVAMRGGALDAWAAAGVAAWLVAVTGEWLADRQLAGFRADPANRGLVCRRGLWRYSRHPNYFFEWLHWWAYVLIAHGAAPTLLGPLVMLVFLFRVTGIPYTERQALRSRGDAYRAYQADTSAFIPWWPRRAGT